MAVNREPRVAAGSCPAATRSFGGRALKSQRGWVIFVRKCAWSEGWFRR